MMYDKSMMLEDSNCRNTPAYTDMSTISLQPNAVNKTTMRS